jgi:hypothetical protein
LNADHWKALCRGHGSSSWSPIPAGHKLAHP